MKRILLLSITLLHAAIMGCASLDKSQCEQGDWYALGHQDGNHGKQASRITKHQSACIEYSIKIDQVEYMRGWNDGILSYCTVATGFSLGRQGLKYNYVCPAELEASFVNGYREGIETLLHETQWEYDANEKELRRYSRRYARAKANDDREGFRKEIEEHEKKHDRLEKKILQLMKQVTIARERRLNRH